MSEEGIITPEQIKLAVEDYNRKDKKSKRKIKINETPCLNEVFLLIKKQLKRKGVRAQRKKISISQVSYQTIPDLNKVIGIIILWEEVDCKSLGEIFEETKGRVIILPMKMES